MAQASDGAWCFDMAFAPKSFFEDVPTAGKTQDGSPITQPVFRKRKIWAAFAGAPNGAPDAGVTWWLPKENRWVGFKEGSEPTAFIALPDNPELEKGASS